MKIFIKKHRIATALLTLAVGAFAIQGCKEDSKLEIAPSSSLSMTASTSTSTVVLDSTHASTTPALTIKWNTPKYGVDLAVAYTLQVDSSTGSWTGPAISIDNIDSTSFTQQQLDQLALSLKMVPNVAKIIRFRVLADVTKGSTATTAISPVISNILTVTVTPYSTQPIPQFPVPTALFIVGDATIGGSATGWNNPVPVPSQQFTPINSYTFAIVTQLSSTGGFLFLPKNGDWSHKYAVANTPANPLKVTFAPDAANNFPAPATSGLYEIVVDFVKATYTLTLLSTNPIPANLYIVGDATPGGATSGWNNPVPVPSQQFTQISNGEFQLTVGLLATGSYLFLPVNGSWDNKYGGASATGGALLYDNAVPSSNTPGPGVAGNYLIDVNVLANTYTVTKQN